MLYGCHSPDRRLNQLLDDAWEAQMRRSPTWATDLGDHRYDDRLPDLSLAAERDWMRQIEQFQRRAEAIPPESLSDAGRFNRELFLDHLETERTDHAARGYLVPLNQLGGPHLSLPLLLVSQPFRDAADYDRYVARLEAFPRQVEQAIECMREGIRTGHVPPKLTVEPTLEQMQVHIVDDPARSELFKPVANAPGSLTPGERVHIEAAVRVAIERRVVPAYRRLHDFVRDEYLPACRETVGVWAVPDGDRIYDSLIARYTTTDKRADEIHKLGLSELGRIRAEMDAIRVRLGFPGPLTDFLAHLRDDPRYRAPSAEWLMSHYQVILDTAKSHLPELFGRLPKADCILMPIETYRAGSAPVAYYNPSTPDGSRPGYFYVNTEQPEKRLTYTMEALTYHEAVPGHHLEFALSAEDPSLPKIRRHNYITAYSEGWALYAESLGDRLGGYTDPLQHAGQFTYDAWRASRLVVDTGIHRFHWTRDQAIAFLEENTGLTRYEIEREVDRYIAWPGQALAYKIGELTIRDLRRTAQEKLGDRFDLRAFHDRILADGPLPLSVLTTRVTAWIDGQTHQP